MRAWAHDRGFSVDGSVRIEGADRTELEPGLPTALRYGARPPFALEHLHQRDAEPLALLGGLFGGGFCNMGFLQSVRLPARNRQLTAAPGVSSAILPEGPFSALLTGVRSNPKRDTRIFFGRENIALYVCQRTDVRV